MRYLVRLTDRALRDLEAIYEFIEAETSEKAFAWFNHLTEASWDLEQFPEAGGKVRENQRLRQIRFGTKQSSYRVIYQVDRRSRLVNVLHIRHGARDADEAIS